MWFRFQVQMVDRLRPGTSSGALPACRLNRQAGYTTNSRKGFRMNTTILSAIIIGISAVTFILGTAVGGSVVLSRSKTYTEEVERQIDERDHTIEILMPKSIERHALERSFRKTLEPR